MNRRFYTHPTQTLSKILSGVLVLLPLTTFAFQGPNQGAGSGAGALGVDSASNISVGTSTTAADTKLLVVASSTGNLGFAVKVVQPGSGPLFLIRNDGTIAIGTSIPGGPSTSTLLIGGNTYIQGTLSSSGAYSGTISASNVTAGVFASGNFAFPSALGLATSSQVGLPQTLSVYGNGYISGNLGLGTAAPGSKLETALGVFTNGNAATAGVLVSGDATGNTGFLGTRYTLNNTTANFAGFVRAARTAGTTFIGLEVGVETNHGIRFLTNGTSDSAEKVRITNAGSVGIGNTNPTSTLSVAGEIRSTTGGVRFPDGSLQTTAAMSGVGGSGTLNTVPLWTASSTLGNSALTQVSGNITASGNFSAQNISASGTITGTYAGTVPASNVTAGTFAAGNFTHQASLGVATGSAVGLPQSLSVYGGGYLTGSLGIGDNTPAYSLTVGAGDLFGVNSSGLALHPAGSANTPSISFTGDPNTGIYSASGDEIGFSSGGTEKLRVSSTLTFAGEIRTTSGGVRFPDGTLQTTAVSPSAAGWTRDATGFVRLTTSTDSVGIRTAQPSSTLHVIGTGRFTSDLSVGGNIAASGTITGTYSGSISATNVTAGVYPGGNFSYQSSLGVATTSNVGLPQQLSVYGSQYISGSLGIGDLSPAYLLTVGAGDLFGVNASGFVLLPAGSQSTPSLSFTADTNTGIFSAGADRIGFAVNATERVLIDSLGRVGLSTSFPSSTLHVIGTGRFTSDLSVGGNIAASGTISGASISGTISAPNVTAGVFSSGNFSFQSSLGLATTTTVGLPQPLSVYGGGYFSGNLGIGTAAPGSTLHVRYTANDGTAGIKLGAANTASGYIFSDDDVAIGINNDNAGGSSAFRIYRRGSLAAADELLRVTEAGNVGIGTTNPTSTLTVAGEIKSTTGGFRFPDGTLQVSAAAGNFGGSGTQNFLAKFTLATSVGNSLIFDNGTNVGLGTAQPSSTFHVIGTGRYTSNLSVGGNIAASGTISGTLSGSLAASNITAGVFASGNFGFQSSLGIATTTNVSLPAPLSVYGNGYVSGNLGLGVTPAAFKLDVNGTARVSSGLYASEWLRFNSGQTGLYWDTGSTYPGHYIYPESLNYMYVRSGANDPGGIHLLRNDGTSRGYVYYDGSYFALLNNAGSYAYRIPHNTVNGEVMGNLTVGGGSGKVDAGTIDPPYTINGKKYATYVSAMTGVKEETTNIVQLECKSSPCRYEIDFNVVEEGSDLWLFAKTTDLKKNFANMTVILTPSYKGSAWYEKDVKNLKLILRGAPDDDRGTIEVSYRLTAPRFDADSWSNSNEDSGSSGFIIND